MASLSYNKANGTRSIQFVLGKKRPIIRLGKMNKKHAESIKTRVEYLVSAKKTGLPLDDETSTWIPNLKPWLADKLANAGLIPKKLAAPVTTLGQFMDDFITTKCSEVKPSTITVYGHTRR